LNWCSTTKHLQADPEHSMDTRDSVQFIGTWFLNCNLAVQEVSLRAVENEENAEVVGRLLEHYYEINAGVGVHKSPMLYGAFPTDPYSHTPAGKGAQQPGMTGQVKEDILSRFGELGVFVNEGCIHFNPCLLRRG
jgi:hypothetical protein